MHKVLLIITAVLLIPATSAFSVVQEIQPAIESLNTETSGGGESSGEGASQPLPGSSGISILPETGFPEDTEGLIEALTSSLGTGAGQQAGQTNEELIEHLEEELATPGQTPLWRQKRILLLLALLLLLGGLVGGFAAAGGGGGSGGASGAISSFDINNLLDSINETDNTGDGTGGGGSGPGDQNGNGDGGGSGDGTGDGTGGGGGGTNNNGDSGAIPEPSAIFLLTGAFALLFLRRRLLSLN